MMCDARREIISKYKDLVSARAKILNCAPLLEREKERAN